MEKFLHLDADESIFFARQLEFVKAKTFDVRYAALKARTLIPVTNAAGPGAATITYEQHDQVGIAKIIASYGDDLPRADIKGREFTGRVRSLADAYGYNLQEIREAQMAGKPLQQRKADSARRAVLQLENTIGFFGNTEHSLVGFFNNPNIRLDMISNLLS